MRATATPDWSGHPAGDCARAHQPITYAAVRLTKKFPSGWTDSVGLLNDGVATAAQALCARRFQSTFGEPVDHRRLMPFYFLPSLTRIIEGDTWIRCDVGAFRVGSTTLKPALANLPRKLSQVVATTKATPASYELCENDPLNNGPDGDQTVFADCSGPADWIFIGATNYPEAKSAPYPGVAAHKTTGAKLCDILHPNKGAYVFVEPPPGSTWTKLNDRALYCWVNGN